MDMIKGMLKYKKNIGLHNVFTTIHFDCNGLTVSVYAHTVFKAC